MNIQTEDKNCIIKAFENNPIAIFKEEKQSKKMYYFKASDIGKVLHLTNIRQSILHYEDDEKVVRKAYDPNGSLQDTVFLTSQGVYRLLYNSKKEIAKKFRKWAGDILDDIIFNESKHLKEQLQEKEQLLQEKNKMIQLLENKPKTEGFSKRRGYIYLIRDNSKRGHYKIGLTEDPVKRLIGLNCSSSTNSLEIVKTYQTKDSILAEKIIHSVLHSYKIKKQKEWFYIHNDSLLNVIFETMKDCIQFTDKYSFDSTEEHFKCINGESEQSSNIKCHMICENKETQTTIEAVNTPILNSDNDDEIVFNRFLNDSCVVGDLKYCSKRDLVYQYKTWSKINHIYNHKNFEQFLLTKFRSKKMMNERLKTEMCCVLGIDLKETFYKFDFPDPHSEFAKFLTECCVKLPTAKLNRTTIRNKYDEWCISNKLPKSNKKKIVELCRFLDKHFFKDKFFEGETTYLGWYGITIKEDILKGTGITSTLCKKNKIYKVYKDNPSIVVKEWDSQKTTAADLSMHSSTLKFRIDKKHVFIEATSNREFYLLRETDLITNTVQINQT